MSEPSRSTDVASDDLTAGLCPRCAGSGRDPDTRKTSCWKCSGSGAVVLARISRAPITEAVAGWKLVPIAPTVAMLKAAADEKNRMQQDHELEAIGCNYYRAMIAASPAHPLPQGEAEPEDRVKRRLLKRLTFSHPAWKTRLETVERIQGDLDDFDGDRRGHLAALWEAEDVLFQMVLRTGENDV